MKKGIDFKNVLLTVLLIVLVFIKLFMDIAIVENYWAAGVIIIVFVQLFLFSIKIRNMV